MKLKEINEALVFFNREVSPGSECEAWGDFVAECYKNFGIAPWDDGADAVEVPLDMSAYWLSITRFENDDYNHFGSYNG